MSNQTIYFQHLVDECKDDSIRWILEEQLQKERRRIAKRKAERLAREAEQVNQSNQDANTTPDAPTEDAGEEQPTRRGRKSSKEQ